MDGQNFGQSFRGDPDRPGGSASRNPPYVHAGGARALRRERREQRTVRFVLTQETGRQQHVVQFFGVARVGARFVDDARDGGGIERPVRGARVGRSPRLHRVRPPLLQRRVVHERVGPRIQHFVRERRRLRRVARDERERVSVNGVEHGREALNVHRFLEAVAERLVDEGMVGNLAVARNVVQACRRIGKGRGHQVVRLHPLQWRRHLRAVPVARHRQRDGRVPAPARRKKGRIEDRLDERLAQRRRVDVAEDVGQREGVLRSERQHQRVLGRRGLQLEVELAAELLPQRQRPGAVDAAAERRVQHELHSARFVEEALEDERLLRRDHAKRGAAGGEVFEELFGGVGRQASFRGSQSEPACAPELR